MMIYAVLLISTGFTVRRYSDRAIWVRELAGTAGHTHSDTHRMLHIK